MDTPRSARRKSKVCYKEDDSFVGEFEYQGNQKVSTNEQAIKSNHSDNHSQHSNSEISTECPDEKVNCWNRKINPNISDTNVKNTTKLEENSQSPSILVNLRKSKSWNPVVVLKTTRLSTRVRHKTKIAEDAEESVQLFKKLSVKNNSLDSDDDDDDNNRHIEKPLSMFTEDDVEGKQMYKFKTMHHKHDMVKKAIESVLESPKLNKKRDDPLKTPPRKSIINVTPKSNKTSKIYDKTPHHIRNKIKKKLEVMGLDESDSGSDFEDSGSDFQPTPDDSSSTNNSDSAISESDGNEKVDMKVESKKNTCTKIPQKLKPYKLRDTCSRQQKEIKYIVKSDNYFNMQSNKKIVTSNHTLDRLKTPRLTEDKLQNILNKQKLSKQHQTGIQELIQDYEKLFDKWMFLLSEGFNILLHGVGSKQTIVKEFQIKKLSIYPCIVVNGYFPSLTLKDILDSLMTDLLDISASPSSSFEAIKLIHDKMITHNYHIFLLIHNIDGTMLKNNKTQIILSKLAKIHNIHLIASIDHINAPLIWNHSVLSDFNFCWWDVTTLLSYSQETSFENSALVHKSGVLALSSLNNVFHSLTTNARGIFIIIVKNQLKNNKMPHYQGMSFKDLYWSARESFLVSSDLALRAQLTEFLDHKLVKTKRTVDGIENLVIPIQDALLQQFVQQNET